MFYSEEHGTVKQNYSIKMPTLVSGYCCKFTAKFYLKYTFKKNNTFMVLSYGSYSVLLLK
jgi:hypothetical protein